MPSKEQEKYFTQESWYAQLLPSEFLKMDLYFSYIERNTKELTLTEEERKFINDFRKVLENVRDRALDEYKKLRDENKPEEFAKEMFARHYNTLYETFEKFNFEEVSNYPNFSKDDNIKSSIIHLRESLKQFFERISKESQRISNKQAKPEKG